MTWRKEAASPAADRELHGPTEYTSALFAHFVERVGRLPAGVEILDLGATAPDNLLYWMQRGHRVAAIDLLSKEVAGAVELGLRGRQFGGILCWNALCALDRDAAALFAAELRELLIPGGMFFAIFDGDGRRAPRPVRYRIAGEGRLRFEGIKTEAQFRAVPTSEIEALMAGLKPIRVTVMRHGSREAVGQAPLPKDV